MNSSIVSDEVIQKFRSQLESHPAYDAVNNLDDLKVFMQHHVYSVWDFMSLIKYLQALITPTRVPWVPSGDSNVRRFINELVLEEETDETGRDGEFSSHFELYLQAMQEIGADTSCINKFIQVVADSGIDEALQLACVPEASRNFTQTTFSFIRQNKPHEVAAALALGREHIIPCMFRSILKKIGVTSEQAPIFHFYLERHIHLDEDFHAPLSLRLLTALCAEDQNKITESVQAAELAVNARIDFWNGVYEKLGSGMKQAI